MTKPATNLIWRFYMDHNHRWKWQQLSVHREVIAESHTAYKDYEECLSDARGNGYDFQPSQAKLVPGQPR
jgi:hypothetical protein